MLRVFSEVDVSIYDDRMVECHIEHISVAVAPHHAEASPLSGSWSGPADAFEGMEVSVQVVEIG
jgi:hypothetical protein